MFILRTLTYGPGNDVNIFGCDVVAWSLIVPALIISDVLRLTWCSTTWTDISPSLIGLMELEFWRWNTYGSETGSHPLWQPAPQKSSAVPQNLPHASYISNRKRSHSLWKSLTQIQSSKHLMDIPSRWPWHILHWKNVNYQNDRDDQAISIPPHSAIALQLEMQTSSAQKFGPNPQYPSLEQQPVSHLSVAEQLPIAARAVGIDWLITNKLKISPGKFLSSMLPDFVS